MAQRRSEAPEEAEERCELCGTPLAPAHRHLLDLQSRQLLCACRACSTLFDRRAAGAGHYRLVPDRRLRLDEFALRDEVWDELRIPVDMAFFFRNSAAERVVAFYPGPMGATESHLSLTAWSEIEAANPVLATMEPDVEALLVNRVKDARRQWLVPIEDCYRLVAVIRTRWRGFSGGKDVWREIDGFFEALDGGSRTVNADKRGVAAERS
ncbi:MAG: hypothetical protein E6G05_11305 [Actinobacteria bacterium]|nr:MAG: hypothetical protein E6G05_11305 [Actinomycetota bacterium]